MSVLVTLLIVLGVIAAALGAGYAAWVAGRHERLAARADAAWAALDAQLVRRATPARTLGLLGGDERLAAQAQVALTAPTESREEAENALSRALHAARNDGLAGASDEGPGAGPAAVRDLQTATERLQFARQFHNDAVRDLGALRRRPAARLMRLGHGDRRGPGRSYFEIDDSISDAGRALE